MKIKELIEELQKCVGAGWSPIDSAPKDGSEIIVYCPPAHNLPHMSSVCAWHEDAGFCVDELREPVLWMPVPNGVCRMEVAQGLLPEIREERPDDSSAERTPSSGTLTTNHEKTMNTENDTSKPDTEPQERLFIADEAPLGTIVQLGRDTPDERIARAEFHRYLFQYFEQLTSGQTGWGVDFNAWLEMTQGWKHHGRKKYERVMSIGEMIDSEPSVGTPTEK